MTPIEKAREYRRSGSDGSTDGIITAFLDAVLADASIIKRIAHDWDMAPTDAEDAVKALKQEASR